MTCAYCGERITEYQQDWNESKTCETCEDTFHYCHDEDEEGNCTCCYHSHLKENN